MTKAVFLLILSMFICTASAFAGKFTLVIDPGHGGKDGGAVRGTSKEKDINLAVALFLGKIIEDNHSDVKVIYTRKTDVFVDLGKRADIANKAKANLFISIHTNSTAAKTTTASGADTYILGLARSDENLEVAKRENSVILLEDNYKQKYEGFDPNSPESYIIFEFMTDKYMEQSLGFATDVQNYFKTVAKRSDRGVKQAGFLVLRQSAMPSVLIELGFINNPSDEKHLCSTTGQRNLANAIYLGFSKYKRNFDKKQGTVLIASPERDSATVSLAASDTQPTGQNIENKVQTKTAASAQKNNNVASDKVEYRVQILTSDVQLSQKSAKLKGLSSVSYYKDGNVYKYTYGSTTDFNEALRLQREARKKFKDAFVVQLQNGKRIK